MKKFIFFPLWEIDNVENTLNEFSQNGFRLCEVKHSYWFEFKESTPKDTQYFMTYKSFRGKSMGNWDYFLLSKHRANPVKTKMCFFSMYSTKEEKEKLSLLMDTRAEYIKGILLEKALTSLIMAAVFITIMIMSILSSNDKSWIIGIFAGICLLFFVYFLYGYIKQRNKCQKFIDN